MRKAILTTKELPQTLIEKISTAHNDEFEVLILANLRAKKVMHALRHLAEYSKANVYLLEDDLEQNGFKQALLLAALLTRSMYVLLIEVDLLIRAVHRRGLIANPVRVLWASTKNLMSAPVVFVLLLWLNAFPKKTEVTKQNGDTLYLFTGGWNDFKADGVIAHITGIMNAFIRPENNIIFPSAWLPDGLSDTVDHQHINLIFD